MKDIKNFIIQNLKALEKNYWLVIKKLLMKKKISYLLVTTQLFNKETSSPDIQFDIAASALWNQK